MQKMKTKAKYKKFTISAHFGMSFGTLTILAHFSHARPCQALPSHTLPNYDIQLTALLKPKLPAKNENNNSTFC